MNASSSSLACKCRGRVVNSAECALAVAKFAHEFKIAAKPSSSCSACSNNVVEWADEASRARALYVPQVARERLTWSSTRDDALEFRDTRSSGSPSPLIRVRLPGAFELRSGALSRPPRRPE